MEGYDYRPYPDMDSYTDTSDVKPADIVASSMVSWDTPSVSDSEYYADWHSDYSNDHIHKTSSAYFNWLKERAFHALSLSKRK